MRYLTRTAIAVIGIGLPAFASADNRLPMMDPDQPVVCAHDTEDHVWRLQCDERTKICLYAPNEELDADGKWLKPLEQARDCTTAESFDRPKLEAAGYKMVQGRADAPYGWMRDERGRVFQINFDLKRRMYVGASYSPLKILDSPLSSQRTSIDFGLLVLDVYHPGPEATRHRIRLFQGEVSMQPFSSEIVVAHYDVSHRFLDPLLRISTFLGEPSRHDLHINLGMWSEAGGLEVDRTPTGNSDLWRLGTSEVTLDLWQSAKLDSYARVRSGVGLEGVSDDTGAYRSALSSDSAFEIDSVLDDAGFNNLRFEVSEESPHYFTALPGGSSWAHRLRADIQYEAILLAINDQPVSLKLAAGAEKRNDLPGVPDQWAFVVDAGLRFSLWAPPRPR